MHCESLMRHRRSGMGEIELDLGRYELRRQGRRVKLEKKPMDLLIFMVGRREQLVSRKEIVTKLWRSDLFIDTEPNINNIVRKIRTALGDDSARPRFLETVIGKGYRFIGPVRVIDAQYGAKQGTQLLRADSGSTSSAAPGMDNAGALGDRSSLAVLPLLLLGKAADDDGLGLGFADALVSRLGNLQGLDVLPTSAVLDLPPETTAEEGAARLGTR